MKKWILCISSLLLIQSSLFADDAPPPADGGLWQTVIMIGVFVFFFYFILFRPEQNRRKASEALRAQIKKGDKVVAMGILGTVLRVQDNTVILKMFDGSKIEVLKAAISDVVPGNEADVKKDDKDEGPTSKKIELIDA